jgi:magnesium-protoporphyrin IX monomethyl ester (oxidative) cyclase
MDTLPIPDFDAFFERVKTTGLEGTAMFSVPIESSRGCWWGEHNHCVFCGLNARDMTQRNKSGDRVFDEVVAQSRHRRPFFATDNILPLEFFDGLFDRLIERRVRFDTFYETKSNLNLSRLRTLRRAGVTSLQPGIESLSTPILREMKKGVSAAQNLWFLRAAEELGFGIAWSILYGFPNEDPAEYEKMAALLPALSHLPPPLRPAPVLLERYSPLFERAESFGFRNVRPTAGHRAAFGDAEALSERAYVFDFDYPDDRDPDGYTAALNRAVCDWIAARRRVPSPRCEVFRVGSFRFVLDTRARARVGLRWPVVHRLTAAEWDLVKLTRELTDEAKLFRSWRARESLDDVLDRFVSRRWLLRSDGRVVRVLMCRDDATVSAELGRAVHAGRRRAEVWLRRHRVKLAARVRAAKNRAP